MDILRQHATEVANALAAGSWKVPRYPCGERLNAAQYKTRYVTRYLRVRLDEIPFNDPEAIRLEALQDLLREYHTAEITWKTYATRYLSITHDL